MPSFVKQIMLRENRFVLGISLLAALGGFLFGYDTGVVSGALPLHGWIALVAMMFYIACFEISLGPIFWVMIAEIFPLRARAKAMAVSTMFNWGFNFLVSFFFLDLVGAIGRAGTFWLYAGFGVLAVTFFSWRVPETKDRSLEQIEREIHNESQQTSPRQSRSKPSELAT